jgi:two-component system OmpR family sensor kinase
MKLAIRMQLIGVAQLAALGAAAIVILALTAPRDDVRLHEALDVRRLEEVSRDPEALHRALAGLARRHVNVSLYNSDRQLIDSNVDPPLAPPPRPPVPGVFGPIPVAIDIHPPPDVLPPPRLHRGELLAMPFVVAVGEEPGILVARSEHAQPPGWLGPILIAVFGVVILVVGPVLTARWIVRPIELLSRTASAFGSGDLQARSRLRRTDEIGDLGRRVDEMADRIEALIRSEKELFANVAHELRTPLARIGVALDLAAAGDGTAARSSLTEIAVDLTELETIVDDILSTIRFEIAEGAAAVPLRRQPVTASAIVVAAVERHTLRHPTRAVDVDLAGDLPALHVDPMLVRRALDNLLENAHAYTPDPAATTCVRVRAGSAIAIFEVIDHGVGIAPTDLTRVFTAFFRGDRSRSRATGGVGLGLTLTRRIVEAHGGTIAVTSSVGDGSVFRFTLPVDS